MKSYRLALGLKEGTALNSDEATDDDLPDLDRLNELKNFKNSKG